jgi:hypothetical protein
MTPPLPSDWSVARWKLGCGRCETDRPLLVPLSPLCELRRGVRGGGLLRRQTAGARAADAARSRPVCFIREGMSRRVWRRHSRRGRRRRSGRPRRLRYPCGLTRRDRRLYPTIRVDNTHDRRVSITRGIIAQTTLPSHAALSEARASIAALLVRASIRDREARLTARLPNDLRESRPRRHLQHCHHSSRRQTRLQTTLLRASRPSESLHVCIWCVHELTAKVRHLDPAGCAPSLNSGLAPKPWHDGVHCSWLWLSLSRTRRSLKCSDPSRRGHSLRPRLSGLRLRQ